MATLYPSSINTPIGPLHLLCSEDALWMCEFDENDRLNESRNHFSEHEIVASSGPYNALVEQQIEAFFRKERTEFSLNLHMEGTEFQRNVWQELTNIPYGKTISYLDLALAMGSEKKTRAVASANGQNKIAIIVPCHRVIGSDGSLTGYAGGVHRKHYLLELESDQLSLFPS